MIEMSPTSDLTKKKLKINIFHFVFCELFKWLDGGDSDDDEAGVVGDPSDRLSLPVQYRTTCRCHRLHRRRYCADPSSSAETVGRGGDDFCRFHLRRKKMHHHRYYPQRWIYSYCSAYHLAVDRPDRLHRPAGLFCALSSDFETKL